MLTKQFIKPILIKSYTQSLSDTCASKLATTYKMTLVYLLVTIHINNQSIVYKVNGALDAIVTMLVAPTYVIVCYKLSAKIQYCKLYTTYIS